MPSTWVYEGIQSLNLHPLPCGAARRRLRATGRRRSRSRIRREDVRDRLRHARDDQLLQVTLAVEVDARDDVQVEERRAPLLRLKVRVKRIARSSGNAYDEERSVVCRRDGDAWVDRVATSALPY